MPVAPGPPRVQEAQQVKVVSDSTTLNGSESEPTLEEIQDSTEAEDKVEPWSYKERVAMVGDFFIWNKSPGRVRLGMRGTSQLKD